MESTEESSWLAVVDGEGVTNGDSAVSPVAGTLSPACVYPGCRPDGVVISSTGFECVSFSIVSTKAPGVSAAAPEFGLGR